VPEDGDRWVLICGMAVREEERLDGAVEEEGGECKDGFILSSEFVGVVCLLVRVLDGGSDGKGIFSLFPPTLPAVLPPPLLSDDDLDDLERFKIFCPVIMIHEPAVESGLRVTSDSGFRLMLLRGRNKALSLERVDLGGLAGTLSDVHSLNLSLSLLLLKRPDFLFG
jgi:hypothetical protein